MAKIIAPNKEYTGVSATIPFCSGVGETDKSYLMDWFREHGYTVEAESENQEGSLLSMSIEDLKNYAQERNIDIGNASSVKGIVKKITDLEQRSVGDDSTGNGENSTEH